MTAYLIADVKVTDDGWVPAYAASVHDIVHKHGGKYLSRSGNVKRLRGSLWIPPLLHFCSFHPRKQPRPLSLIQNTLLTPQPVRAAAIAVSS